MRLRRRPSKSELRLRHVEAQVYDLTHVVLWLMRIGEIDHEHVIERMGNWQRLRVREELSTEA